MRAMLDIETLATAPNPRIAQIGCVIFEQDGNTLDSLLVNVDWFTQTKANLDQETLQWWFRQETATDVLFGGTRVSIDHALLELHGFLQNYSPPEIWAQGTHFDISAIEAACFTFDIPNPWEYNTPRCLRTLKDLAKKKDIEYPSVAPSHNARDDCLDQIQALIAIEQALEL